MGNKIQDEATLKSLNTRLNREQAALDVLNAEIRDLSKKRKHIILNIEKLKKDINDLKQQELTLSEHAIIRYIERIELIPVDEIKKKVVTEELLRMWKILGNGSYPVSNTQFSVVIKNGVITTIIKND